MLFRVVRLVIVLLVFLPLYACESAKPTLDSATLKELEVLLQQVPIFPGMVEVNGDSSSLDIIEEGRRYKSEASFADVKRFYVEQLNNAGWQFVEDREIKNRGRIKGERQLEFRRGSYQLRIRYAGERAGNVGWDYTIKVLPEE